MDNGSSLCPLDREFSSHITALLAPPFPQSIQVLEKGYQDMPEEVIALGVGPNKVAKGYS
ncbi:hypothetical protein DsansV1_C17g0144791 [Dioscorea sansibarensis]